MKTVRKGVVNNMYYDMYYHKKESKKDDKREEKAFLLLKSLKDKKMDNREFAQMREDYYRALGDLN